MVNSEILKAAKDWSTFYRAKCVKNETAICPVSEFLDDDNRFQEFTIALKSRECYIKGRKDYRTENHSGYSNLCSNRWEEMIAFAMSNSKKPVGGAGVVLAYQVPMKIRKNDVGVGKAIDLVTATDNALYIVELKQPQTNESILRCLLEAYTYYLSVNHETFKRTFNRENAKLGICVMVFDGEVQKGERKCRICTGRQLSDYLRGEVKYAKFRNLVGRIEKEIGLPVLFQPLNVDCCCLKSEFVMKAGADKLMDESE